jgi:hypothetical protein
VINKIEVKASIGSLSDSGVEVVLDGEVLPGVRSAEVSTELGYIPTVTVELTAREVVVGGELHVELGAATAEVLEKLGWTAPGEVPVIQS